MKPTSLALLLALCGGCVVYEDEAELLLAWEPQDCVAAGTAWMRVELYQDRTYGAGLVTRVPCTDGGVGFAELEPDTYIVLLIAEEVPGVPVVEIEDTIPVRPGENVFSYRF